MKKFVYFWIVLLLLCVCSVRSALAQESKSGDLGIGVSADALNFGFGPTIEFWPRDHVGLSATYQAWGNFTGSRIRGIYSFGETSFSFSRGWKSYLGAGFASLRYEETIALDPFAFVKEKYTGTMSGPEFYYGLRRDGLNLSAEIEFSYGAYDVKGERRRCIANSCEAKSTPQSLDYSGFSGGIRLIYVPPKDILSRFR